MNTIGKIVLVGFSALMAAGSAVYIICKKRYEKGFSDGFDTATTLKDIKNGASKIVDAEIIEEP